MEYFVFVAMVFCHVVDDYVLQAPCLCDLKQKSWWSKNAPARKYENDYMMALLMHSASWAFMISLPAAIYSWKYLGPWYLTTFCINTSIHYVVDDLKANRGKLNLIQDQFIHIIQIVVTFLYFMWKAGYPL